MSGFRRPFRAPPVVVGEVYREKLRQRRLRKRMRALFALALVVVCAFAAVAFLHAPGARASWRFEAGRQGY